MWRDKTDCVFRHPHLWGPGAHLFYWGSLIDLYLLLGPPDLYKHNNQTQIGCEGKKLDYWVTKHQCMAVPVDCFHEQMIKVYSLYIFYKCYLCWISAKQVQVELGLSAAFKTDVI